MIKREDVEPKDAIESCDWAVKELNDESSINNTNWHGIYRALDILQKCVDINYGNAEDELNKIVEYSAKIAAKKARSGFTRLSLDNNRYGLLHTIAERGYPKAKELFEDIDKIFQRNDDNKKRNDDNARRDDIAVRSFHKLYNDCSFQEKSYIDKFIH
jgi:ADP-dependent phosphofructokinase/glucokinase